MMDKGGGDQIASGSNLKVSPSASGVNARKPSK